MAIILVDQEGRIAVVTRHPNEPAEGGKIALPGGYVELGQRQIDAAETEVLEETGYTIVPGTLARFALLDGPAGLPGRSNEHDLNVVTVFTACAGQQVRQHDDEVTAVSWVNRDNLPDPSMWAFGHHDIIGMWCRHLKRPFRTLPIVPSEMSPSEIFPARWPESWELAHKDKERP